jgi:hypothetical protein
MDEPLPSLLQVIEIDPLGSSYPVRFFAGVAMSQ